MTHVTHTTEGPIPHRHLITRYGPIEAPVCVHYPLDGDRGIPRPMRKDGVLLYALPGGEKRAMG